MNIFIYIYIYKINIYRSVCLFARIAEVETILHSKGRWGAEVHSRGLANVGDNKGPYLSYR